ncbi:MAG TPA: amino acid ABC transporter permease, partial [Staphylococcus sp.]|nr:amino acid ABC transporter permease [Staphylococcus sp.]
MGTTTWPDLFAQILDKLPITLFITVLSLLFAMILGLVLAVIRIKKVP